jgi:hypothetical protein
LGCEKFDKAARKAEKKNPSFKGGGLAVSKGYKQKREETSTPPRDKNEDKVCWVNYQKHRKNEKGL